MYNKYLDLFEYIECHDFEADNAIFQNVTMLKDFGPLKAGEKYFTIQLDLSAGKCNVWSTNDQDEPNMTFNFTLAATE